MKQVTKKERLNDIKEYLIKGIDFIKQDNVEIIVNYNSMGKSSINKEIGSELCYLYRALEELESLILNQKVMRVK